MVVVPAGVFRMGCLQGSGCAGDELPVRHVAISVRFALSKHEITFSDWDACVEEGGCGGYLPSDEGWGRGSRPVIHVNWDDAQAYVKVAVSKYRRNVLAAQRDGMGIRRAGGH